MALTRDVGMKVGPLVLEVLVKHWFERLKKDDRGAAEDDLGRRLHGEDIFYDEAFAIIKSFLQAATQHTVEEMQSFSNTRTPSPPWVHVVRTLVPLSCCDEAAPYLIKALGGEDVARQLVGGVKWWQVRGVNGVDAQWITMKNDWEEAKRRYKMQNSKDQARTADSKESQRGGVYDKDMDAMRCILYLHGGGYYFGSVDQTRYSIQRFARKINGRAFAINYRLAPQYPFPCGLHDALAAYLFLIRPPAGSDHRAVNPAHIVISGDSAGGGLALALLQVIRDSGLPQPAGGVLISPWCDLTHSFPSVFQNTKTDIIPESGLSFHKPSILWPPPSPDMLKHVHASLRFRIKQALGLSDGPINETMTVISEAELSDHSAPLDAPPQWTKERERVTLNLPNGERREITDQIHFYAVNSLLSHPFVSPVTGYLGGLPPLMFVVGNEEVLRDEIIYTAHKAAYPEKYSVPSSSLSLCPHLKDIETRPTSVHLQVYDGTPHILPVLFPFTTPAKFCFRSVANFDRFVTEMKLLTPVVATTNSKRSSLRPTPSLLRYKSLFGSYQSGTEVNESVSPIVADSLVASSPARISSDPQLPLPETLNRKPTFGQLLSSKLTGSFLRRRNTQKPLDDALRSHSEPPDLQRISESVGRARGLRLADDLDRMAGDPHVYENINDKFNWECRMIRERVSTSGVVRHLEPEEELAGCKISHDVVAQLSEASIERYITHKRAFDHVFEHGIKAIDKHRLRNLAQAKEDTLKRVTEIQRTVTKEEFTEEPNVKTQGAEGNQGQSKSRLDNRLLTSPGWAWSWVLDESENPPPSSIVSRRDTEEARQLAAFADRAIQDEEHRMSGNNLWNVVQNFLSGTASCAADVPKAQRKEAVAADKKQKKRGDNNPVKQQGERAHRFSLFSSLGKDVHNT